MNMISWNNVGATVDGSDGGGSDCSESEPDEASPAAATIVPFGA